MGGTNTFLKTAGHIKKPSQTAILGIQSPSKFAEIVMNTENLCSVSMNEKNHKQKIDKVINGLRYVGSLD